MRTCPAGRHRRPARRTRRRRRGQLLIDAAERLHGRAPGFDVRVREVQLVDAVPWLLDGEVEGADLLPAGTQPSRCGSRPGDRGPHAGGPAGHALADQRIVSVEDLAGVTLLRPPDALPGSASPAGSRRGIRRPPRPGPVLPGDPDAGRGRPGSVRDRCHARRYYARPDVAYVPFRDAPTVQWILMWRADGRPLACGHSRSRSEGRYRVTPERCR